MNDLFEYFKHDDKFADINDYDEKLLDTYNRELINKIQKGVSGWEDQVPEDIANRIKQHKLFGFNRLKQL